MINASFSSGALMSFPPAAIVVLWVSWIVGWRAIGWANRRGVIAQPVVDRLAYGVPTVLGALVLAGDPRWSPLTRHHWLPGGIWTGWFGLICVAVGLGFTVMARRALGRYWSVMPTLKASHAIIRSGPYAVVRHPIYTGLLVALFGTAAMENTLTALAGFAVLVLGFVVKARQEERLLVGRFGPAYQEYRAAVPALIPGVRPRHRS
jgi:protein-S-isoprenylcysteine O-methyltransferase Ste14